MKNHDLTIRHKMLSFGNTLCTAQRLARPKSSFPFCGKLYTYVSPRVSAYRELPVSQFSLGKPCFHYREPLFSLQGFPCKPLYFPVRDCSVDSQYSSRQLTFVLSLKHQISQPIYVFNRVTLRCQSNK